MILIVIIGSKGAGMLTNFQTEVEGISSRAKEKLSKAQSKIDLMKQEMKKISFENISERQCALGKIECLTFRIVTATKKFKSAIKSSWKNIKDIEERKKRLTFAKPVPKFVPKSGSDYSAVPTME